MTIKIINRYTGQEILIIKADSLQSADLRGASLRGADLQSADLQSADLQSADLRGASLRGADLRGADLRGADLRGADLYGADLYGASLRGADLYGADLRGTKTPWMSHEFLAEAIRQAAGEDIDKRKIAGLILISRDWCWRNFWVIEDPLRDWVIQTLKPFAEVEGSDPPDLLKRALGMPIESDDSD